MTPRPVKDYIIYLVLLMYFFMTGIVNPWAQTLTVYTIPATRKYNWESPGTLVISYLANIISKPGFGNPKHLIGHMMVELKDNSRHVIAGVSAAKNAGMTRKVIFQGHGLGILFDKISGVMDETATNLPEINQRASNGEIAFLQFRLNQALFNRLWQYYSEYMDRGYYRIYNGLNNPFYGEGAGCSAFAFSFLEVGGIQDMVPPEICRIERPVPFSLIQNTKEHQGPVSLLKLLFARKWAAKNDPTAREYTTYEPTWLFDWIKSNHDGLPVTGKVQKIWLDKSPGILIDCSDKPVPTGSVWKN